LAKQTEVDNLCSILTSCLLNRAILLQLSKYFWRLYSEDWPRKPVCLLRRHHHRGENIREAPTKHRRNLQEVSGTKLEVKSAEMQLFLERSQSINQSKK